MSEVPSRVSGSFLWLCREAHDWFVKEGFAQATPQSERHTMALLAEKCREFIVREENGERWYLVTALPAPILQ